MSSIAERKPKRVRRSFTDEFKTGAVRRRERIVAGRALADAEATIRVGGRVAIIAAEFRGDHRDARSAQRPSGITRDDATSNRGGSDGGGRPRIARRHILLVACKAHRSGDNHEQEGKCVRQTGTQ